MSKEPIIARLLHYYPSQTSLQLNAFFFYVRLALLNNWSPSHHVASMINTTQWPTFLLLCFFYETHATNMSGLMWSTIPMSFPAMDPRSDWLHLTYICFIGVQSQCWQFMWSVHVVSERLGYHSQVSYWLGIRDTVDGGQLDEDWTARL